VLSRRQFQSAQGLFCDTLPAGHEPVYESQTSGSTGEPVVVRRTAVNGMDWLAVTMREHLWHRRDFLEPLCAIRASVSELKRWKDWGPPVNWLFPSGPLLGIPVPTDVGRQIELIRDFKPRILLMYPSNLAALMDRWEDLPCVRQILTIGETLSPRTRDEAARRFGAITDTYSSQELGTIAIQCPQSPLYHVMAENLLVEVLNGDGTACREGESGRVVATDLRNFATPIIRYDIGDVAQVGPACPCGRGLPTLSRIFGRERNLVLMPDGTRHWPLVGFCHFREIAPVMQYQFIQDGRESIELRLVTERALSPDEEAGLTARVRANLGFAFTVRFTYLANRLPPGANGKFEEFVCRVAAHSS
jgi:phenylacetate-CoA ligase